MTELLALIAGLSVGYFIAASRHGDLRLRNNRLERRGLAIQAIAHNLRTRLYALTNDWERGEFDLPEDDQVRTTLAKAYTAIKLYDQFSESHAAVVTKRRK